MEENVVLVIRLGRSPSPVDFVRYTLFQLNPSDGNEDEFARNHAFIGGLDMVRSVRIVGSL